MDSDQLTIDRMMSRPRREFGDRRIISVIDGQTVEMTYRTFFARVDRLAWALRDAGIKSGDRVGTVAWNHHRHLELYVAVTGVGAVLHTVNARLSAEQLSEVITHADDALVFVDSDLLDALDAVVSSGRPVVRLGAAQTDRHAHLPDYESLLADQPDASYDYPIMTEGQPAATSYSSATTGRPKGVVYTHRAIYLHSMMLSMADTWAISGADTILPVVPMFHVNAWGLPFAALWTGATLVLPGERPTAATITRLLADHEITFAAAVPTVWMDVFETARRTGADLSALRLVVSGGGPLTAPVLKLADALSIPLIQSYGMTEATPLVLVGVAANEVPAEVTDKDELRMKQGRVVPGLDYRIEAQGRPVPRDGQTAGELLLRGPWVAESYERDERSDAAFEGGWYHTGDLVTIDAHGCLRVVDRMSDLIKSGGEWISSLELESALLEHPAIDSAVVVAVPDDRWQERPRAFVVSNRTPLPDKDIRAFLAERFPRFWIPDTFVEIDAVPQTSVGKIDKKSLRARAVSPQPATHPATRPIEEEVR
ncbi:long-chain-fatty-acid--CoA ligase [Gordonia sp. (in: high G+C Gram-positive bacteria)]|uniref:long-chain-fatty-acid--CoA ligase n=1 Tax=Gordonia sp. (in: high G+C Gram-positive bacteria) TaxID=84139 RepID=UPI00333EDF14